MGRDKTRSPKERAQNAENGSGGKNAAKRNNRYTPHGATPALSTSRAGEARKPRRKVANNGAAEGLWGCSAGEGLNRLCPSSQASKAKSGRKHAP